MPEAAIAVVIPTRNRAEMAVNAVASVLAQGDPVRVFVSDNSTDAGEREVLAARYDGDETVTYMRPEEPLPMTAHWEWAMRRVLDGSDCTHVTYLTDRMCFKRDALGDLRSLTSDHSGKVITYNHDAVDDRVWPIALHQYPWSGKVLELNSAHLLWLSSRGVIRPPLPRMLNTLAPREALEQVAARFGSVFDSIAPDFCFAYRCLDLQDSILYYDKSLLIQYGLDRSNGASYSRGEQSRDRVDFEQHLGGRPMNFAAPVPEFQTIRNVMFHEYNYVRAESGSEKFPPVDPRAYMAAVVEDLSLIESPAVRGEMLDVLRDNGWSGGPKARYRAAVGAIGAGFRVWDVARGAMRGGTALARRLLPERRAEALRGAGIPVPAGLVGHESTADAIEYAEQHPLPRTEGTEHLEPLLDSSHELNRL